MKRDVKRFLFELRFKGPNDAFDACRNIEISELVGIIKDLKFGVVVVGDGTLVDSADLIDILKNVIVRKIDYVKGTAVTRKVRAPKQVAPKEEKPKRRYLKREYKSKVLIRNFKKTLVKRGKK